MQSIQEAILEEFIQRSFGASFLFVPKKYRKGNAQREPADLAWVTKDFIALFYLTSSTGSWDDQVTHNQRQASGYRRLWSTGRTEYALRGLNRFGDQCFVPYSSTRKILTINLVSCECGVSAIQSIGSTPFQLTIVLPDKLLHWISDFGGTFTDLLIIIRHTIMTRIDRDADSKAFAELSAFVADYILDSINKADPDRRYLRGTSADYYFISEHITRMRMPASFGGAISSKAGRDVVSGLFGDFALVEYASLVAAAEMTIQASDPPRFSKWAVFAVENLYYRFVIATVNFQSTTTMDAVNSMLSASKDANGIVTAITFQYGKVFDWTEYRTPMMIGIPPQLPRSHAAMLVDEIILYAQEYSASRAGNDA